jgi:hypothetical protein
VISPKKNICVCDMVGELLGCASTTSSHRTSSKSTCAVNTGLYRYCSKQRSPKATAQRNRIRCACQCVKCLPKDNKLTPHCYINNVLIGIADCGQQARGSGLTKLWLHAQNNHDCVALREMKIAGHGLDRRHLAPPDFVLFGNGKIRLIGDDTQNRSNVLVRGSRIRCGTQDGYDRIDRSGDCLVAESDSFSLAYRAVPNQWFRHPRQFVCVNRREAVVQRHVRRGRPLLPLSSTEIDARSAWCMPLTQ